MNNSGNGVTFDAVKVKASLDEIQKTVTNMLIAINDYVPEAKSFYGSSGNWTGPINEQLSSLKKAYQENFIPETKPLIDWIKDVENEYARALSSISNK